MKKTIRIISLFLVIVMLASLLSACKADKKFIGTWNEAGSDSTMVFAAGGTGSFTTDGLSGSLNWSLDGDRVFLTLSLCGVSQTEEFTYKFSGDTMTLTGAEGELLVLEKVK